MKMDEIRKEFPTEQIISRGPTTIMSLHSKAGKPDGYISVQSVGSQSWRSVQYIKNIAAMDNVQIRL